MAEILARTSNVGRYEEYLLMKSQDGQSLRDMVGEVLDVDAFVIYERQNAETGEPEKAFSMFTPEKEVFGSGSQAFCETFLNSILECFEPDEVKRIKICAKQSKKTGHTYIYPVYLP